MKAWIYRRYGGPDALELADIEAPVPRAGELRLKVGAFALNPLDWKLRSGQFRIMTRGGLPRGVGYDVAGIIDATGPKTTLISGTRVVATVNPYSSRLGGAAELACVKETAAVAIAPRLTFEEAASLPGSGLTALQALRKARLEKGQRALVIGASGGVGSFAVLLAKIGGARVVAAASAAGQHLLERLAPDRAIDHSKEDWRKPGERFDLVFDCTGATTFDECRPLLAERGTYAQVLPNAAVYRAALRAWLTSRQRVIPVMARPARADLERLVALAAEGKLHPPITRIAGMADVPELLRELEAGRGRGKLVVRV